MRSKLFIPLQKADLAKRQVWGVAAVEQVDSGRPPEIMDYARSKPNFIKWSESVRRNSFGKSLGNVRAMHGGQMLAVGRVFHLEPRDKDKSFYVGVEVVDDAAWEKVQKGVYTGFSIGGRYGERWPDDVVKNATRYEAIPNEISLVDVPCIPGATFEVIKMDGASELRKFEQATEEEEDVNDEEEMTSDEKKQSESAASQDDSTEDTSGDEKTPDSAPEDRAKDGDASSGTEGPAPENPEEDNQQASLDIEEVKSVVMSILMDLGLAQPSGSQPMSMAMRMDDLQKRIMYAEKGIHKMQQAELQKAMSGFKSQIDEQVADLRKTVASDIAQVVLAVQALEKRGGPGPVVRDLGVISPHAMAEMQKAAVLRDMLPNADPLTRQKLEAEITRLEIKAAQTSS